MNLLINGNVTWANAPGLIRMSRTRPKLPVDGPIPSLPGPHGRHWPRRDSRRSSTYIRLSWLSVGFGLRQLPMMMAALARSQRAERRRHPQSDGAGTSSGAVLLIRAWSARHREAAVPGGTSSLS